MVLDDRQQQADAVDSLARAVDEGALRYSRPPDIYQRRPTEQTRHHEQQLQADVGTSPVISSLEQSVASPWSDEQHTVVTPNGSQHSRDGYQMPLAVYTAEGACPKDGLSQRSFQRNNPGMGRNQRQRQTTHTNEQLRSTREDFDLTLPSGRGHFLPVKVNEPGRVYHETLPRADLTQMPGHNRWQSPLPTEQRPPPTNASK